MSKAIDINRASEYGLRVVSVHHARVVEVFTDFTKSRVKIGKMPTLASIGQVRKENDSNTQGLPVRYEVSPHGGETTVVVEDIENGKQYRATAACSRKDIFSRQRGRIVAFGRIIAALNEEHSKELEVVRE